MKYVFLGVIAIVVAVIISNGLGRDAEVKLVMQQAEQQSQLDAKQRTILANLEAMKDATVSEFVNDWRGAYPKATVAGLQELQVIEQKIKNDVRAAGEFTLAAHQKRADQWNKAVYSPFGGEAKASKPGL